MRKICAKMVPRILTHNQKQLWLHISSDLLRNAELFDRVITGDEMWCFQYDLETKWQSIQWKTQNSPWPKKARMSQLQVKTMLLCFFDHKGIVYYEFIAQRTNSKSTALFGRAHKVTAICSEEKTQTLA